MPDGKFGFKETMQFFKEKFDFTGLALCVFYNKKSPLVANHRRGVSGTIGGAHPWASNDQYVRISGTISKL